ncbi:MAG: hypothetical protein ACTHJN_10755 [Ginsengibacter sp.]
MKISEKIMKAWSEKRTRGDVSRLTNYTKASKPTIIRALNHGEASESIILKISRFYSEKKLATPEEIESEALKLFAHGQSGQNN